MWLALLTGARGAEIKEAALAFHVADADAAAAGCSGQCSAPWTEKKCRRDTCKDCAECAGPRRVACAWLASSAFSRYCCIRLGASNPQD